MHIVFYSLQETYIKNLKAISAKPSTYSCAQKYDCVEKLRQQVECRLDAPNKMKSSSISLLKSGSGVAPRGAAVCDITR